MKHSIIPIPETLIDIDDFAIITMRTRIETGEDVDNEEFKLFVKKCQDLIRNLRQLVGKVR